MSEWITDRRPTDDDAGPAGLVWTTYNGKTFPCKYDGVEEGTPWMPMIVPKPYVKPKRYTVKLFNIDLYKVIEVATGVSWATVPVRDDDYERAKEAAERIAAIYEEVMP